MAIFPVLELEDIVQTNDKTRLDGSKLFTTPDEAAITLVEIEPETSAGFIPVTTNKRLDYQYSTTGTKTVTLRVTTDGSPVTATKEIEVLDAATDNLFSSDAELTSYEPKILSWVRAGRSSFLDVHRAAQQRILKVLDENGFWDKTDNPLTKEDIITIDDFQDWSKFMVLRLIFEGISNAIDDIFHEKAMRYRNLEAEARDRSRLRVDLDNDGDSVNEDLSFRTIELIKE